MEGMTKQIAFSHPRRGLEGQFSTFRLGANWATRVAPGDEVELVDSRSKKLLKLPRGFCHHGAA